MNCKDTHDMIQRLPISNEPVNPQVAEVLEVLNKRIAYLEASVGVLKNHVAILESNVPIKI